MDPQTAEVATVLIRLIVSLQQQLAARAPGTAVGGGGPIAAATGAAGTPSGRLDSGLATSLGGSAPSYGPVTGGLTAGGMLDTALGGTSVLGGGPGGSSFVAGGYNSGPMILGGDTRGYGVASASSANLTASFPGASTPAPLPELSFIGAPAAAPATAAAPAAPVTPAGTTTGGGGPANYTATVDMRHVQGTPQPGGVIDTLIRYARPMNADAKSEGGWTTVGDQAGAQMHVHVHGYWASNLQYLQSAVVNGYVDVHLHPDGTVHVHDK